MITDAKVTADMSAKYGVNAVVFTGNTDIAKIRAGDIVRYYGTVYTARDAAHKRLCEAIARGEDLPIDLRGACLYYCGVTPAMNGEIIGSCGPTSSIRMDKYTEPLLRSGIKIMIGKGARTAETARAIQTHGALYLCATGGAACYIKQFVTASRCAAYPELGCEAVLELKLNGLPLVAAIDHIGGNIFDRPVR